MITQKQFEFAVNSKIGYLTKYYVSKNSITPAEAYTFLMKSYVIQVLKNKDSRLFLESIELLKEALELEFVKGKQTAQKYLESNIGV